MSVINRKNIMLLVFPDKLIVSQITPISPEQLGECDLLLTEPFVVETNTSNLLTEDIQSPSYVLSPWLIEYTTENKFHIHSDKLVTMTTPSPKLLYQYEEVIA